MNPDEAAYHELYCYTLTHTSPAFILQHVVDAFAAQDAREGDKPIRLTFALVGLLLHIEKGLTGRQVQLAHMKLTHGKKKWPALQIPQDRGAITATTVLAATPGPERDQAIDDWCGCVWRAFAANRKTIEDLLRAHPLW